MASRPPETLTYRPALDGLRGLAVLAVLAFHLLPDGMRGGWLGVDLFFVLSGFLITTLLVREYARHGTIDLRAFWLARARRLLPPLIVMLLFVAVAASFLTPASRRPAVGLDVLGALLYIANWRFLASDESYFSALTTPSPLLHTWSLAIEEQFYLVFPLLFLLLARFVTRRRTLAGVFVFLAVLSALAAASLFVPGVEPTRVYYGTDTRAFELLIGAAAGAWLGPRQWGRPQTAGWLRHAALLAWPGLAVVLISFTVTSEHDAFPFRGGMVLFCLAALLPIIAAASPHANLFQQLLSFEPLRRLGLISYSLYLWHWPVHVFTPALIRHAPGIVILIVQAALSLVLAVASYRWIERPIRRHGLRDSLPSRFALATMLPIVAVITVAAAGAGLLTQNTWATGADSTEGADLRFTPPPYAPGQKHSVLLLGNSVPNSLDAHLPRADYPDLTITSRVSFGCTPFTGQEIVLDSPRPVSADCKTFTNTWDEALTGADAMVYFTPHNLLNDYTNGDQVLRFGTTEHDAFVRSTLDDVTARARRRGVLRIGVVTLACHRMPSYGIPTESDVLNDTERVKHLDTITRTWANEHHVTIIDQYGFLCANDTFHGRINGVPLYSDGLHFTADSAPIVWRWLGPQLQALAGSRP